MFDDNDSAAVEMDEIQQMLYVYYGLLGQELDHYVEKFRISYSKLPHRHPQRKVGEISFPEFMHLINEIAPPPRRDLQVPLGGVDDVIETGVAQDQNHSKRPWRDTSLRSPRTRSPRSPRPPEKGTPRVSKRAPERRPPKTSTGKRAGAQMLRRQASFAVPTPPPTPPTSLSRDPFVRQAPPRRIVLPNLDNSTESVVRRRMFEKKAAKVLHTLGTETARTTRALQLGDDSALRLHKSGESELVSSKTQQPKAKHVTQYGHRVECYATKYGIDHRHVDTSRF